MADTKAFELCKYGQSIWLDYISRSLIKTGKLKELIKSGLRGMTSNPTIFDKSIKGADDYDDEIRTLSSSGKSAFEIYDDLTVKDIQDAAGTFRTVYEKTNRLDGYVSLEINPELADKAGDTVKEGRRLYQKVNRPNVMFKVPATDAGFLAVEELIGSGINVNVTLIFSSRQYVKTAEAYMRGIERFLQTGGDASGIRSVASVFVSRVDTLCDRLLDGRESLKGKAAAANAALIYKEYRDILSSDKFKELFDKGANVQRLLWGSTSTKDPDYSDIKYVTELIGRDTVNTMPQPTFEAFLDHGRVKEALPGNIEKAQGIIDELEKRNININGVCLKLLRDGVRAFNESFLSLLDTIEKKSSALCVPHKAEQKKGIPGHKSGL
jgi:transaldolase